MFPVEFRRIAGPRIFFALGLNHEWTRMRGDWRVLAIGALRQLAALQQSYVAV